MKEHYDVIIVGTGAAGLYCALNLPAKMTMKIILKIPCGQDIMRIINGQ